MKENILIAKVDNTTFNKFKSGELISNNGLRTHKGNFASSQPEFYLPKNDNTNQNEILTRAAYITMDIAALFLVKFIGEKIYPLACKKFDELCEKKETKKDVQQIGTKEDSKSNIIQISDANFYLKKEREKSEKYKGL